MTVPFNKILSELSGGRTHETLTERMGELVERVSETGASGTLTPAKGCDFAGWRATRC